MNTLHVSSSAYIDALILPELQAELVLAASRLVGTRVVSSGLSADFFVCRECAGRGRDRHLVQHLPECVAGMVAHLLLVIAHREAERVSPTLSPTNRKEPSQENSQCCEPAGGVRRESRPHLLPKADGTSGCQHQPRWVDAGPVAAAQGRIAYKVCALCGEGLLSPGLMVPTPILPALYDEPWTVDGDGDVYSAAGHTVVDMHGCTLAEPDDLRAMHRIAACVNHCKGVPSEELTRETERAAARGAL